MLWATDELGPGRLELKYPYFEAEPTRFEEPNTYTDGDAARRARRLRVEPRPRRDRAGGARRRASTVTRLVEHDELDWPAYPWFEDCGHGHWRLPGDRSLVPLSVHPRGAPDLTLRAVRTLPKSPGTGMAGRMHGRYHSPGSPGGGIPSSTGTARQH